MEMDEDEPAARDDAMELDESEAKDDAMELDGAEKVKVEDAAVAMPLPKPISQMKVAELKEELKKRDLSTAGLKAVLQKRLEEAVGQ